MDAPEKTPRADVIRIEVAFNPVTAEFSLLGCDANPVVALGMLDYALARIRRALTQGDIEREILERSRIVPASRLPQ